VLEVFDIIEFETSLPHHRNVAEWQTRQVEGLVAVMVVQVQVLSPALVDSEGLTTNYPLLLTARQQ
jgi:hypothetical protein